MTQVHGWRRGSGRGSRIGDRASGKCQVSDVQSKRRYDESPNGMCVWYCEVGGDRDDETLLSVDDGSLILGGTAWTRLLRL